MTDRFRDALEQIALLDEADGHELTAEHALQAVAIATSTLGKHPSEIFAERAKPTLDPTSRGDCMADEVRQWYEAHRERWRDRHNPLGLFGTPDRAGVHADNFILELINAVYRIDNEMPE